MTDAKKTLGQHWLKNEVALQSIVDAADIKPGDTVLEIGPGLGDLTEVLVETNANILALEFDEDLIPNLKAKFSNCKKFAISKGDIRTFDYRTLTSGYKIVANIPYYLTSHLIRSISETENSPSVAVLLIQKEVAQRLCALPGKMGILSVTAQFYFDCKLDLEIPAKLFLPPPKVNSQVVILTYRQKPLFNVDEKKFFHLVKAGFSNKRKTLSNSLSAGLRIDKTEATKLLVKAGIQPSTRAQNLSLDQWYKLYSYKNN